MAAQHPMLRRDSSREEYNLWKDSMLRLLDCTRFIGFVDGGLLQPPETTIRAHQEWQRMDRVVKNWIVDTLSPELRPDVVTHRTSRDVWLQLEAILAPLGALQDEDPSMLYRSALRGDWVETDAILRVPGVTYLPILNTALRIAMGTGNATYVENLALRMPVDLLSVRDDLGNNALHVAAVMGNLQVATILVTRRPNLLHTVDIKGCFPILRAAQFGHRTIVEFFMRSTEDDDHASYVDDSGILLVKALIDTSLLDIALRLIEMHPDLARRRTLSGYSVLTSIALNFAAFESGARFTFRQRLIYSGIMLEQAALPPRAGDADNRVVQAAVPPRAGAAVPPRAVPPRAGAAVPPRAGPPRAGAAVPPRAGPPRAGAAVPPRAGDADNPLEDIRVEQAAVPREGIRFEQAVVRRAEVPRADNQWGRTMIHRVFGRWPRVVWTWLINQAIRRLVPQAMWFHDQKLMHYQAVQLLRRVRFHMRGLSEAQASPIYGDAFKKAAELGVHEVIEEIVGAAPFTIFTMENRIMVNLFHMAVNNRCEKVFNLFYQLCGFKYLCSSMADNDGNTILHEVAHSAPPEKLNLVSGAALQMQRELQWFKEVNKFVKLHEIYRRNKANETPEMVFTKEHKTLKAEGEKWMKDTATSCSISAALIVTVMFAAAITVPGGNDDDGYPSFRNSTAFIIFAVSDALSLFTSITSLLMFLSILTSRYAEEDFLHALPKRLCVGLFTLFISILSMMVAFGSTIYLVFGRKYAFLAAFACFPVASFVRLQFPLLFEVVSSTCGRCRIFGKQSDRPFH